MLNIKDKLKNNKLFTYIKNIPKTYIFFLLSCISALIYPYSQILFIIIISFTLLYTIKRPYSFIFLVCFYLISLFYNSFFIVTDIKYYSNIQSVQFGSGKIYLDKSYNIKLGDILYGTFEIDKTKSKPFFKPVYKNTSSFKIYHTPFISDILQFRKNISDYIFYNSGGKITVAQALILGDKTYISDDLKDAYTISGLFHLLSMSGSHVAVVTAIFITLLIFLPIKIRFIFATLGVLFLIILGGFNVTVIRASLFASIIMVAYIFDINVNSKKFILFIAGLFLIVSPASIKDISFLMSFGAVFGIVYMLQQGYGYIKTALITGIAATLITAPLSMYVFGTTNHLSILSTMIISPIIYLHILFSMFSLIAPNIAAAPLFVIETISNNFVIFLSHITYFGFIFKYIPLWLLILSVIYAIITLLLPNKWKFLSLISLLVIFYPAPKPNEYNFLYLSPRDKGFIIYKDNKREIFYQGSYNSFKYKFLPFVAKYGYKTFDNGEIRVFGGNNNFIKIKNISRDNFTNTCLNKYNNKCKYFYHTKSNTIKEKDINNNVTHIIWKNKYKHKSIIEIEKNGNYLVND